MNALAALLVQTPISEASPVTLGVVAGLLAVLIGTIWWAASMKKDVEGVQREVAGLRSDVSALRTAIDGAMRTLTAMTARGVWTRADMLAWVAEARARNGTLDLPLPRNSALESPSEDLG